VIGVTSFSPEGYEKYGKNFLKFIDFWPGKIICYLEEPIDFEHEKLIKRDFFEIPFALSFITNIKEIHRSNGVAHGKYNYNFDVNKFCRKMFCQYEAFKEGGKVFWLDSDLEFKSAIPEQWLNDLFDGQSLVLLDRAGFYSETGFVGFDTEHKDFKEFAERYSDVLKKGIIFSLKRWHDCEAFDWAREGKGKNLTPWWDITKAKTNSIEYLEVMSKSILDEYIVHHKGRRKDAINT